VVPHGLVQKVPRVAVPLFDQSPVILARLREHRPLMQGSTEHSAHRLRAMGFSKRRVVFVMGSAQAVFSLAALGVATTVTDGAAVFALTMLVVCWLGVLWMLLRSLVPMHAHAVVAAGGAVRGKE
jgi:hypothetical protein